MNRQMHPAHVTVSTRPAPYQMEELKIGSNTTKILWSLFPVDPVKLSSTPG